MMSGPDQLDDLLDRVDRICNGDSSPENLARLEELAASDEDLCWAYICYSHVHAGLRWAPMEAPSPAEDDEMEPSCDGVPAAAEQVAESPQLPRLPVAFRSTFGYLSSGWPVAYLAATVILGIGLLIAAGTHVSQPVQVATHGPTVRRAPQSIDAKSELVGWITGMADCKWANGQAAGGNVDSGVSLRQRFALASGLLEITYNTGAKVILQGPVTYEVESSNGGFMPVGKLTGIVENGAAKGFQVRTPTAIVTDLGTEFGIEVDKHGNTSSHVFRGSVSVQMAATEGKTEGPAHILRENESVRVEQNDGKCAMAAAEPVKPADFARKLPGPSVKTFDLADVVAGGNGFSGRRNAGIDPAIGRAVTVPRAVRNSIEDFQIGDGKYHRVESISFVDGVFIIDGGRGPVQTDSSGRVFVGFPTTTNRASYYIWAGGPFPNGVPYRTELGGVDYAASGHAVLYIEPNKGITFDLDAVRLANPDFRLVRFCATAGNTETAAASGKAAVADLWVLVDGQVRFERWRINSSSGAMRVNIRIGDKERFLTLAATDGGDGDYYDWTMFGDPRLELATTITTDEKADASTSK